MDDNHELQSDEALEETHVHAIVALTVSLVGVDNRISRLRNICRDSIYRGHMFVREILQGHPVRFHELFLMENHVFRKVLSNFSETGATKR